MEIESSGNGTGIKKGVASKKADSIQKHFNSLFPNNNVELFDSEKETLTAEYEAEVTKIFNERDHQHTISQVIRKRSKIQLLYGVGSSANAKLSESLLHMAFEEGYTKIDPRLTMNSFKTTSVIHWRPLWDMVEKMFTNDLANTNLQDVTLPENVNFLFAMKTLRIRFDDESIAEVYELHKKLRLASSYQLSLVLLRYFLKISRRAPTELYRTIFEEISQQLAHDLSGRTRIMLMTIIYNLASTHPELEWEKVYDIIFTYFSRYYLQKMPLGIVIQQTQQKTYFLSLQQPPVLIPALLVTLIAPVTETAKHTLIWENIHRFFCLLKQYLHPNYENTPTIKFLLHQFQQFIANYVSTHAQQRKAIESMIKAKAKVEKKIRLLETAILAKQVQPDEILPSADDSEELDDGVIDADLANEDDDSAQSAAIEKIIDQIKSNPHENGAESGAAEGKGHHHSEDPSKQTASSKEKMEEEEGDDADDDDGLTEDDQVEFDSEYLSSFIQKTPEEQQLTIERLKKYLQFTTERLSIRQRFALDKACDEQFESIVEEILVNVLYLNDQNRNLLPSICKDLCYFNPEKFIPIILGTLTEAFEKPDMNFSTTIAILTAIVIPIVDRNHYKRGLYEIPSLMRKVLEIFNASDFSLSLKIWKFFDQIFQVIPIHDVDELLTTYLANNPTSDSSAFYAELNKDEEIDMRGFYEQMATVSTAAFQKFLSMLEHVDMPRSKHTRGFRAAVISVINFFTSIAFSASKSLFAQLWSHAFNCITDRQQTNASKVYSYLIHAFTLRDPKLVLPRMIPYLSSQILVKREAKEYEGIEKSPLYYLLANHPRKEDILSWKIDTINSNALFWYLNLLEDTIFFGRHEIIEHRTEIENIIFQCFLHTEIEVSKKACQLLQKVFHSLITYYPSEMYIWSENEISTDINFKEMYHKYIGQNSLKKFSMQWHVPTEKEADYAKQLFFQVYTPILDHYNTTYFAGLEKYDYSKDFTSILDNALIATDTQSRAVKTEHQRYTNHQTTYQLTLPKILLFNTKRSIMILFHLYSSIATRLKWGIDSSDKVYDAFAKSFCLSEYNSINQEMITFSEQMFKVLLSTNQFYDNNIAQVYLSLILFILGHDDQNAYINSIKHKLKDLKTAHANPYRSYLGYPRFIEVSSVATQFNSKIILYTFDVKLDSSHAALLFPLLFLVMHPIQKISERSMSSFSLLSDSLPSRSYYNEVLKTFAGFLESKLSKKSADFLPRRIEESQTSDAKVVPILSTFLERVISSQKILNYAINHFSEENYFIINTLFSIVESYSVFPMKLTKDKIIEIPLQQLIHLANKVKKLSIGYSTLTQQNNIYKEKSKLITALLESQGERDRKYLLSNPVQKELVFKSLEDVYQRCAALLDDPSVFSKEKSFMLLLTLKTVDFTSSAGVRFAKVFHHALDFTVADNLYSRNLGRAVMFKCIQTIKAEHKTRTTINVLEDSYLKNQQKTLEEIIEFEVYKQSDILDGFSTNHVQCYLLYKKSSTLSQHSQENLLRQRAESSNYIESFLEHLINDITAQSVSEPALKAKNIYNNSELIFQQEFIKNLKKKNFLSTKNSSFQVKLLKKFMSLTGWKCFEAVRVHLEKHKLNESTIEGQQIVTTLVFSSLLAILSNEIDLTADQKKEAFTYLMSIVTERIYSLNLEQFMIFMNQFEQTIECVSFYDSQAIIKEVYGYEKLNNQADQKYYRLLYVKTIQLIRSSLGRSKLHSELLNHLKTVNPLSIQQLPFYNFVHSAIWSHYQMLIDYKFWESFGILKDIGSHLDSGRLKKVDSFQAVVVNNEFSEIYEFIVKQLNSEDQETRKKYYRLTKFFTSIFKEDFPYKTEVYYQMQSLFPYLIQFKEDEIADQQLVQELWQNLLFVSFPLYTKEVVIDILQLCHKTFKNPLWRVRQRALVFNQNLAFLNLFRISEYNQVDQLLEMMNDEQKQNKSIAQKVLTSVIKTMPQEQVGGFVQRMQKMSSSEDKNEKIIGVYCLMSVLLSYPNDIKEWTENAIRTILKNRKITPDTLTLLKEFGAAFLRNTYHNKIESKLKLPEDLISRLEEISRPHNYFA